MNEQHPTAPAAQPDAQIPGPLARRPFLKGFGIAVGAALVGAAAWDAGSGGEGSSARSNLTLIAPAAAGGGWDGAARELQQAMRAAAVVNNSQVLNIPGAGGTIGLSQVVSSMQGEASTLMVMGITMLGAIKINGAANSVDQTTPIARLTDDYDVVVVPADSPVETMEDLVREWATDPKGFAWGGGSLGSVDQMIITQLAIDAGIDAPSVNYIAYSGGGELATSLLSGTIKASCSGYEDFSDQIEAGRLRGIAVSAPEPVPHIDLPTLVEEGHDVSLTNWRGIVAPPGITDAQRSELEAIIRDVHASAEWQEALERNGWTDTFQVGPDFEKSLAQETTFVDGIWAELGY